MGGIAMLLWMALALFTYFVPPHHLLLLALFLVLFGLATMCTLTPCISIFGSLLLPRLYRAAPGHSLRQSTLLTLVLILNMILKALHSWEPLTGLISLVAAVILEALILARK
jgi:hypothetical protein